MKKLFESWRKYIDESKVVDLNRHAFNTSADELYQWFETLAYQDMSIDDEAENYDELVQKRAEYFKFGFLGAVESNGIEMALDSIGIPAQYLGADMLGSLYAIMAEYDRRQKLFNPKIT
jgi:hypothetical protein